MLTYKEANTISIKDYLKDILNIIPVKDRGYYGMYQSPFRNDNNASLKVDYNKNLWIDFGSSEGGTLIDLVMRINRCSEKQALDIIQQCFSTTPQQIYQPSSFSFHGNNTVSAIRIEKVLPITHKALIDFLKERCVNIETAKKHCREIRYSVHDKPYFAIGFQNDNEGWVLRSEPFKGCTSMDISSFFDPKNKKDACLIFEGFMDYLSYLTLKNVHAPNQDIIVLNSVTNLPKAINLLGCYKEIHTYLDNDEAGKNATLSIRQIYPNAIDHSANYANHKDLNEYLISSKRIQQKEKPKMDVKRKPSRGFRR